MTFQAPLLLLLLVAVPLVAVLYALMQRRRRKYAVTFTNVDLLAAVAGRSYTRHVPAVFALLAFAALLVAIARPERTVDAERREANVLLVFDTSGSMLATDVQPSPPRRRPARGRDVHGRRPGRVPDRRDRLRLQRPAADRADDRPPAREDHDPEPPGRGRDRDGRRAPARVQLRPRARAGRPGWVPPAPERDRPARRRLEHARQRPDRRRPGLQEVQDPGLHRRARQPERHAHAHRPEHGRDEHRARPAGPADAAGHRARHGRPVLRHRRREPARRRVPQHRHAAHEDQGEAAGDVGVRRRRARAAADRRRLRPRAGSAPPDESW